MSDSNALTEVGAHGGRALRIPGFDVRQPGAQWNSATFEMQYLPRAEAVPCYRLTPKAELEGDTLGGSAEPEPTLALLPNRSYLISALIKCDFERPGEVTMGMAMFDAGGKSVLFAMQGGIPNKTQGWQRWEWEFATDPRAVHGRFTMLLWAFPRDGLVQVADIAFVELPAEPLKPYAKGQGVTLRGSHGSLPMRIEAVEIATGRITVRTTGALFTFDTAAGTIATAQRVRREREISVWRPSLDLRGLEVLRQDPAECILANDNATFGMLCDSLMMVAPHEEMVMTCESKIGGEWNRLACGHLTVIDEYGGMAVNPDTVVGSGRLARVDAGVLAYQNFGARQIDFSGVVDDVSFISSATPGWQVKWLVSPGERLAISVFPPRPYSWRQSFEPIFVGRREVPLEKYAELAAYGKIVILWNFIVAGSGDAWMSGREHIIYDEDLRRHVRAVKETGMVPILYMSPWYYHSRNEEEFLDEVKRLRDTYGIEGVYYDGHSDRWLHAYELMRMTRELFPDGTIVLHDTQPAPLLECSLVTPAISTYADMTLAGELVWGFGPDWIYPRYIPSQFRTGSCVGVLLHDKWEGVTAIEGDLLALLHNARGSSPWVWWTASEEQGRFGEWKREYFPVLMELKKLWEQKGGEPDFYEEHYLPRAKELVLGRRDRDMEAGGR